MRAATPQLSSGLNTISIPSAYANIEHCHTWFAARCTAPLRRAPATPAPPAVALTDYQTLGLPLELKLPGEPLVGGTGHFGPQDRQHGRPKLRLRGHGRLDRTASLWEATDHKPLGWAWFMDGHAQQYS